MAAKLKRLLEEYMKYNNNETRNNLETMITQIGWTIKVNTYKSPLGTFSSDHLFEVSLYLLKELQNGAAAADSTENSGRLEEGDAEDLIHAIEGKLKLKPKEHQALSLKAKKKWKKKKGKPKVNGWEERYLSPAPRKRVYGSLLAACKEAVKRQNVQQQPLQEQQQEQQQQEQQ